jgi:hypothetical protein
LIGVSIAERTDAGAIVPAFLDHIRLDNVKGGLWQKLDYFTRDIQRMKLADRFDGIVDVAVEEALVSFRPGKSSADTITMLIRINVLASNVLRTMFGIDPRFIPSSTARKLAGVKVRRTSKVGKSAKDQVFAHMCANDLSHVIWPLKRNGDPKELAKDITDAWVVAKACAIVNP